MNSIENVNCTFLMKYILLPNDVVKFAFDYIFVIIIYHLQT